MRRGLMSLLAGIAIAILGADTVSASDDSGCKVNCLGPPPTTVPVPEPEPQPEPQPEPIPEPEPEPTVPATTIPVETQAPTGSPETGGPPPPPEDPPGPSAAPVPDAPGLAQEIPENAGVSDNANTNTNTNTNANANANAAAPSQPPTQTPTQTPTGAVEQPLPEDPAVQESPVTGPALSPSLALLVPGIPSVPPVIFGGRFGEAPTVPVYISSDPLDLNPTADSLATANAAGVASTGHSINELFKFVVAAGVFGLLVLSARRRKNAAQIPVDETFDGIAAGLASFAWPEEPAKQKEFAKQSSAL